MKKQSTSSLPVRGGGGQQVSGPGDDRAAETIPEGVKYSMTG